MKIIGNKKLLLLLASTLIFVTSVVGQETKPAEVQSQEMRPAANQPQDIRANVLRQLGLSREQIQQIRRMNIERKPLMDAAQERFREANRALDEAIYADQVNEADVQSRLRDVQLAQAEVARIRFMNELAVRRILTPDQLIRFRELRQRFEQARENFQNRRPMDGERPANRPVPANNMKPSDTQRPVQQLVRPNGRRPEL